MATDLGSDELSNTARGEHNRLQRLGKYRIEKRIGAGGMGTVFLAIDTDLNRTVALKVLPRERASNPVLVRRFKAEGQAAAQMEHPNIVRVFEAGEADGFLYMALEYVEGIDVYELVERRGVIPVRRSTDIIRQTALALQHADEKGIVHRDIKPSNLLIKRDGSVKLADMGLARSVDETMETNITRAGTTVGTVDYMSPEQARSSKSADVRSDIYSLGCTWYHMLTGHPPFTDGGMTNKLQAHAVSPRPDPRAENDHVPEGIVAIIGRMMACKPEDRYQSPQELLEDLEAAGRMHRTVDESALAALADGEIAEEAPDDETDSMIRLGDIDDLDLAALGESAEYEAPAQAARPIKPRSRSQRKTKTSSRSKRGPGRKESPSDPDVAGDPPPATSDKRAFAPLEPDGTSGQQAAARRTLPPAEEPPTGAKRHSTRQPTRSKSPRRPKRGTVTRAGGAAAELPAAETPAADVSQPAEQSPRGIDPELLKIVIPVVLVVAIAAAIGFALLDGGDSGGTSSGNNPYGDDGSRQEAGPQAESDENRSPQPDPDPDSQPDPDPTESTSQQTPQVDEIPFPGAEDAQPAADQLPLIPGWVDAFRRPVGDAERTLLVRRRPEGSGQVASIREAIGELPRGGGTIEIDGDGPFPLEAVAITNLRRVRLQAAEGSRPVLQLIPPEDWTSGPLVSLQNTQVEFEGLHFVLVDAGADEADLFRIDRGNVVFRDCSITLDSTTPAQLTAVRVTGGVPRRGEAPAGKCLLENVVIRGAGLTSIALDGPEADLVLGNCLLAAGNAPAIVVTDSGPAGQSDEAAPHRGVRLLATTVLSTQSAISLQHDGDGQSVEPVDLVIRRSLLGRSTNGDDNPAAMITLTGWPRETGGLGASGVKGLAMQVEQTTFAGWPNLLRRDDISGNRIEELSASTDDWRKFWNQGLRSDAVAAEFLPLPQPANVTPQQVHADLSAIVPETGEGQLPGCRPWDFAAQPTGLIAHVAAAIRQPEIPARLGGGMKIEGDPIRFDLGRRRSLSRFLASDACPGGSHVIAHGSGLKQLDPLIIENKSLRLQFESTDKPLVIQPRSAREGAAADEALITVRNGTLDLVGASLKLPASNSRNYPGSLILLEEASLALRYAKIEGPSVDAGATPLIRTSATAGAGQSLLIENSFLVSPGPLVSGTVCWETLIARNCLLVSRDDAITATVDSEQQLPASIVLDHCTLATGGAAIRADVGPSAGEGHSLAIHTRSSVFAGPVDGTGDTSVVVASSAGAARDRALIWWGSLNGYSDRLAGSLIDGTGRAGDFAGDWLAAWGDGHEAHPLTGKADVLFLKPLPDLRVIKPADFKLSDSATAATWDRDGGAIGADVDDVGPEALARIGEQPTGSGAAGHPGSPRSRNDPGF